MRHPNKEIMRKLIAYGLERPITAAIVDKKGKIISVSVGKTWPQKNVLIPLHILKLML